MRSVQRLTVYGGLVAAVLCLMAAPSWAAGLSPVVADCNAHDTLTRAYTVPKLRPGLATMPADVAEYTDCHDVIEHQLLAQLGALRGGGPGSGGGGFLPTPVVVILILLGLVGSTYAGLAVRRWRAADRTL